MCTSNRDGHKLENTVTQSRFKHLGELHKEWTEAGVSASRITTHRHLQEKDYQALLKPKHCQKHLTWAKEKKNWTVAQWSKVLFSDESTFQSMHFIWKSSSQSLEEEWRGTESMLLEVQCEVSTVSDDLGCHVIYWCWSTVFSEVHSQSSIYQDISEHVMLPSADKLYGDADFIFQQDLEPAHTAKGTKSWFNDHGVTVLDWPVNSPDLNPIENIWGIVKRKMRDTRPNNADDLKAAIKATWASITPEQCHRLSDSMPRHIDAVIHAKGGSTKYWV